MERTSIFLYELDHLASLDALMVRYRTKNGEPTIISFDAEIDYELGKRGIPFLSGAKFQDRTEPATFLRAAELTRDICASEVLANLKYRNIPIFELLRFSLHHYFFALLTRIHSITRAVDSLQGLECIVIPAPCEVILPTSGFFAESQAFACVQAAHKVAESRGIAFEMVQDTVPTERMRRDIKKLTFIFRRAVFSGAVILLNAVMSLRRRGKVRLIASDYWRNIAPVARMMPEAQIILIDRTEALKAGWRNIWRHRMRLVHLEHYVPYLERRAIRYFVRKCKDTWRKRPSAWGTTDFMFCGVSLLPECEGIVETFIERAIPRIASDIAGAYAMYAQLAPDAVWVRVSGISRQTHFSILPLVAEELGIPSLELQHGIEYLGPGSATLHHVAQHLALYGDAVAREFETAGYAPERLISVGSPRFDFYSKRIERPRREREEVRILSTIPGINPIVRFGTYSVEEHFAALQKALKALPQARLTVTSRNVNNLSFLREAMKRGLQGMPYEFAGTTPLPQLFADSDIFLCSYSTVIYESMLHGLPTVLVALSPVERLMMEHSFAAFEKTGALAIARSSEELMNILQELSN
ncbi:MAG: hypothetical protein NTY93_02720, partial [Candidatus Kaiserbacteria bacterium]|nr:hypothetical protein [Candidatus Kaiserbacteria bacterium]